MRVFRSAHLLAALCALVCAAGAPTAHASVRRGLHVDAPGPANARSFDLMHQAGADTVRFEVYWPDLQPTPPSGGAVATDSSYVAEIDATVSAAAARGIRAVVVLDGTPCWASSAPSDQRAPCVAGAHSSDYARYAPSRPSDYAAIAAWVAHRWGAQLAALEIWNEPNFTRFFTVDDSAAYTGNDSLWVSDPEAPSASGSKALQAADEARAYVQLTKAAYPAVKAQAPDLPVLGGALAYSASGFLSRLYADGFGGTFDAVSIHPYDDRPLYARTGNRAVSFAYGVPDVHSVMANAGDADRSLWLTEFGWPTCAPGVMDWCVSEDEQAGRLTEAFEQADGWPYVAATIVYMLRDTGTDPNDFEQNMGLVRNDWSPKPGWGAFADAIAPPAPQPAPEPAPAPAPAPPADTQPAALPSSALPPVPPRRTRPHAVTVLRVRRVDRRHAALLLACRSHGMCRSHVDVEHGRRRLATIAVTLGPARRRHVVVRLRAAVSGTLRAHARP